MNKKPYVKCHCGADCPLYDEEHPEECWGEVLAVDEWWTDDDYGWIHACEAHEKDVAG